jgi:hypothetical protein
MESLDIENREIKSNLEILSHEELVKFSSLMHGI